MANKAKTATVRYEYKKLAKVHANIAASHYKSIEKIIMRANKQRKFEAKVNVHKKAELLHLRRIRYHNILATTAKSAKERALHKKLAASELKLYKKEK